MKDKFLYCYYFALILVLALYTNMSHSPNVAIRLSYLSALVLPLLMRVELLPAVIVCTYGITKSTFAYPFMPTEMYYYITISGAFAVLIMIRNRKITDIKPLFVLPLLYVALNDIVLQGKLSSMVPTYFLSIMFFVCIEEKEEAGNQILPISFILISMAISYWVYFCPEAQINTYDISADEEMEQTGWTDPNYLSVTVGAGLVLAVRELLYGNKNILYKGCMAVAVIGAVFAMVQLASRGMILSATFSIVLLLAFSEVKLWYKIIVLLLSAGFVYFLYTNEYLDFVITRFEEDDGTFSSRTEIWAAKLSDFFKKRNLLDWIIGVGQETGIRLGESVKLNHIGSSTHNDFVSMLVYYGFIGLALFFSIVSYPLRICSKQIRMQIVALLVYLLMCSMTIEPLAHGHFVYWSFFFYIILLARQSQKQKDTEEQKSEKQS